MQIVKILDVLLLNTNLLDTLGRLLIVDLLLQSDAVLHSSGFAVVRLRLPCRRSKELDSVWILEHFGDLLESLVRSFWENEKDVNGHRDAEDGENNVGLPFDADEGWWDEVTESEVEGPVAGGREGNGLATEVVRVQLWWVDPGDGAL